MSNGTLKEQIKAVDDKLKEQDKRMEMKERRLNAIERDQVRGGRSPLTWCLTAAALPCAEKCGAAIACCNGGAGCGLGGKGAARWQLACWGLISLLAGGGLSGICKPQIRDANSGEQEIRESCRFRSHLDLLRLTVASRRTRIHRAKTGYICRVGG